MKRGQVTLFVILGLVLLSGVLLFVYLKSQINIDKPPVEQDFLQSYDVKTQNVLSDVNTCLEKLGKEIIIDLGVHGGYADVSNFKYNMPSENSNDALELFPDSGLIVPYWAYITGSSDCRRCFSRINIPQLEGGSDTIQTEIQDYINDNLVECVGEFKSFSDQFDVQYEQPVSTVIFRNDDVFIGLKWPLNITLPDKTVLPMENFNTKLDVKFRKMYSLARNVLLQMELLETERALETFTMDVVDYLSLGGKDALIPPREGPIINEIEAPKLWMLDDVKNTLKEQLSENIPFMQVSESREAFFPFTNDSYQETIYSNFQNKIFTDQSYLGETKIRFNYFPNWPLYLRINPGAGSVVMPEVSFVSFLFLRMGFTRYKFSYDITYPVLVTFEDNNAFKGEGYKFQYAYEVNVRNNGPYSNETVFLGNETEEPPKYGASSQRTVPVKIRVRDGYTLRPLPDITVAYTCGEQSVIAGTSKMENGDALIDTLLQPCIGGYYTILSPKINADDVYASVVLDKPQEFVMKVYPEKEFNLKLSKRIFKPSVTEAQQEERANEDNEIGKDREWRLIASPNSIYNLVDDEVVTILLTEIKNGEESSNVIFETINKTNEHTASIFLTPGLYKLQIFSLLYFGENNTRERWVIPERRYEVPDSLFSSLGVTEGSEVVIPDIYFNNSIPMGGVLFDNSTVGYLNISVDNLFKTSVVNFYYASYELTDMKFAQDTSILGDLDKAVMTDESLFKPKFT